MNDFEEVAPWYIRLVLRMVKMDEIVLFGTAYYLKNPSEYSLHLRLHATAHIHQFDLHGFVFPLYYLIELLKVGYSNNKYELQAESYARMRLAEKGLRYEFYKISDSDYVRYCYEKAPIKR